MTEKRGRPRKEVDWKIFVNLCALQCTETEIAAAFDMTVDTLNARCKEEYGLTFSEVYRQKRGKGTISLRRMQWQAAEKGSPALLIFLGKQYLGQSDKAEITGEVRGPIVIVRSSKEHKKILAERRKREEEDDERQD